MPGILMSAISRSKEFASAFRSASTPFAALSTAYPAFLRVLTRCLTVISSSSAMSILKAMRPPWQRDGEHRASTLRTFHRDVSVVLPDDIEDNGEPQAGPLVLCGIEWLKDLVQSILRDPLPRVGHRDRDRVGSRTNSDTDLPLSVHGICGVQEQIDEDLLQLVRIRAEHCTAGCRVEGQRYPIRAAPHS